MSSASMRATIGADAARATRSELRAGPRFCFAFTRRIRVSRDAHWCRRSVEPSVDRRTAPSAVVVTNLVENAVRYAPPGSAVTVQCTSEGSAFVLRVIDAGTGIPPEAVERVFDAFVQVEGQAAGSNVRGGRGLGLAFCRLAAEAHGSGSGSPTTGS